MRPSTCPMSCPPTRRPPLLPVAWLGAVAALAACGGVTSDANGNPPPAITAIAPATGGIPGGATITVTGSGFADHGAGENHAVVGGVNATDVVAADDRTLTFRLPPGRASGVALDVVVFNSNGFGELPASFTYNPQPTVSAIAPALAAPGAPVTVTGAGFQELAAGENRVFLGGQEAASVDVVSDTELTARVPARGETAAFAPVDVAVANDNGAAALAGGFRYARPGILLATNGRFDRTALHFVDLDADPIQTVPIATLDDRVSGMALAPTGVLYVATNAFNGANRLGTLDPATGHITYIGFLRDEPNTGDRVKDLAFVGQSAYVFLRGAGRLAVVNLTTGRYTIVGAPPAAVLEGPVGIAPRDGASLFLVHALNEPLKSVDIGTSVITDGPALGSTSTTRAHAMLATDGGLLAVTRENVDTADIARPNLVRIDPTSGEVVVLGTVPAGSSAMAPTPPSFDPR